MKRRRLNEDDLALWRKVTERTEKLDLNKLFTPAIDAPPPAPPQVRRAKNALQGNKPLPPAKKRSNDLRPSLAAPMKAAPVQMTPSLHLRRRRRHRGDRSQCRGS